MKQNPVVLIIVLVAMVYAFYMIPHLSQQAQTHYKYEYYSEFYNDLRSGAISEVTLINQEQAEGKFKPGGKESFEKFEVPIPPDEDLANTLITAGVPVSEPRRRWRSRCLWRCSTRTLPDHFRVFYFR